jgi:U4/U6 small nuclear ribonucleoprotein PRP31
MIEMRRRLMAFVEGMMSRIAPNVTAILGSSVASQLVSATGGIKQLAQIPAGNIQVIGAARKELHGLSIASARLHAGFIDGCDLVQATAPEYQTRAQRLVAAKVSLAARIDALRSDPAGRQGAALRQEIVAKLEKLAEPAPTKAVKPIPPPPLQSKTKRGGKRARKQKELLAMTKVRKLQNRVAFGTEAERETFVGDSVVGLGMLGSSSGGAVRAPQVDNRAREAIKKQAKKATTGFFSNNNVGNATSVKQATSGMATSLTIATGIGLSNPAASTTAASKPASRYFNTSGSFKRPANT